MNYRLSKEVKDIVSNGIFISGSTRSGTTMMGQLISSLANVEYAEEPPMLRILFPLINNIPEKIFKFLFEGYIFEEHMMFTIPGRKINVNRYDQSSIFNSKSELEIHKRLSKSYRRLEIFPMALSRIPAFKLPEVGLHLKKFFSFYPKMRVIIMLRNPESVISSMLEREWYSDKALKEDHGKWLFLEEIKFKNRNTPDWLKKKEIKKFYRLSEMERCMMYYKMEYENIANLASKYINKGNIVIMDYNRFVSNPKKCFNKVLEKFDLKKGKITNSLIKKVKEPKKDRKLNWKSIRPQNKSEIFNIYEKCLRFSLQDD